MREIELADRVIIPSEFVRRTFLEAGVPEHKLRTIPYGIDLEHFRPSARRDSVFRVLFVGNIGIQKGVHYLLEAWKRLALPGAELRFIGTVEEEMKPVLARYEGLYVHAGHVKHEELHREYGNASLFILPSLQEGSALVTYEAMACGLPSIVSENTGSVVRDGEDGFVIPIRSSDAIAEKLQWMYDHRDEAAGLGSSAEAYVRDFTWDRYATSVVDCYRDLLDRRET